MRYAPTEHSNRPTAKVPAGETLEVWAKYPLPQDATPQFLTLVVQHGMLFKHVKVS